MKESLKKLLNLFSVPLFCLAARFGSFWVTIHSGGFYAQIGPNNTISTDPVRVLILEGILFLVTLALGFLIFRKIPRKTVLWSAIITAALTAVWTGLQIIFQEAFLKLPLVLLSLDSWSGFLANLPIKLGLGYHTWLSSLIHCLSPLLFVLFGKKSSDA